MTMTKFFKTSKEAWSFMHYYDALNISAGYPSLNDNDGKGYSVKYVAGGKGIA